jgi:prepilin-type N-terminal cleavage/methylation domain-containing protein
MNNKGVTMIELIVVVTIVSILVVAHGFELQGWMGRYRTESQTKTMYVDLMNARARAMQRNRAHFVTLPSAANATSYSIFEDNNPAPDGDNILQTAADTLLQTYPKTVEYGMNWNWNGGGTTITLDREGIVTPSGTLYAFADRDGNGIDDFDSDYSCIVIFATRINMGKCNGVNCATCGAK